MLIIAHYSISLFILLTVLSPVIKFNRLKESILQIVMGKSFKTVDISAIIVRQQIGIDAY